MNLSTGQCFLYFKRIRIFLQIKRNFILELEKMNRIIPCFLRIIVWKYAKIN